MEDSDLKYQELLPASFELYMCNKCGVGFDENNFKQHTEECSFISSVPEINEQELFGLLSDFPTPDEQSEPPFDNFQLPPVISVPTPPKPQISVERRASADSSDGHVTCPICSQKIAHSRNLKRHIISKHENYSFVQCSFCEKKFSLESNLKRHILFHHKDPLSFKCNLCENAFYQKNVLDNHILKTHTTVRRFNCDKCGFGTMTKKLFLQHLKSCIFADNESEFNANSEETINKMQSKPIVCRCSVCELVFQSIPDLLGHIKCHDVPTPIPTPTVSHGIKKAKKYSRKSKSRQTQSMDEISGSQLNENLKQRNISSKERMKKSKIMNTLETSTSEEAQDDLQSTNHCPNSSNSVIGSNSDISYNSESVQNLMYESQNKSLEEKCQEYNFLLRTDVEGAYSSATSEATFSSDNGLPVEMRTALANTLTILYQEILSDEDLEKYQCKMCHITCLSAMALENHMKRHM